MTLGISSLAWRNGRKVLKGGVRSWLSGSKDEEMLPAESTSLRFSLRDNKRHVHHLVPAPRGCLAAAADSLGRVLLMDTHKAMVLRIWKGYRDAQCGWITHPVEQDSLLLVIYGWRRETLEVWQMRYGPRICSLSIGSQCRLLPTMTPMGLGDGAQWTLKCAILDFENEEIWEVGQKVFPSLNQKVEPIWDMMLPNESI